MEVTNQNASLSAMNALAVHSRYATPEALANSPKVDDAFLEAAWSTQPSLERDFALHLFSN